MTEWLNSNKLYLAAAVAALGIFLYYSFFREPVPEMSGQADPFLEMEERAESPGADAGEENVLILVDVKGEVRKPGVYRAEKDERVIDMIERAGGLTEKADAAQVNFAQKLEDEMVIFIPLTGTEGPQMSLPAPGSAENGKININKADAAGLQEIPGIGPAKAAAIIEYREKNGPFKDTAQLKEISGIGEKTYEKLESSITVR
ncbi:helix-hairpin-helix domain-containing protein [Bacillus sp. FJAT-27245]|uniref:helix-hairpin-helix domain-containing protein n=1 Tax=Bacillus sp. FJAT-27245 TaxID=1684144 RepID=UPI0006A7C4B5|nr:helix-hairpin-helix domain-containing protein [Bacillus sp. FJAT-27245]